MQSTSLVIRRKSFVIYLFARSDEIQFTEREGIVKFNKVYLL